MLNSPVSKVLVSLSIAWPRLTSPKLSLSEGQSHRSKFTFTGVNNVAEVVGATSGEGFLVLYKFARGSTV